MTEDVLVTIKGLQFGEDEQNAVEVMNIGKLSESDGIVSIQYQEMLDGGKTFTDNTLKLEESCVDISRSGSISSNMRFVEGEKTMTFYNTPFGNVYLGILTKGLIIEHNEELIHIEIDYALEANYEQISECKIEIDVKPRSSKVKLI